MPTESPRVTRTPRLTFPDGFTELTAAIRLPESSLDFEALLEAVADQEEFHIRSNRLSVFGSLKGERGWGATHGHVTVSHDKSIGIISVEFEVVGVRHGNFSAKSYTVFAFLDLLAGMVKSESHEFNALIGANFSLSISEWTPTFPVPFSPPSNLDHIPGVPQISGLDFSFAEPSPSAPLFRAFVTTYSSLNQLAIRFLAVQVVTINRTLVRNMVDVASQFLPSFATRRPAE